MILDDCTIVFSKIDSSFHSGWLLSCIFFVFGALLAYAGLLYKRYWTENLTPKSIHKVIPIDPKDGLSHVARSNPLEVELRNLNFRCLSLFVTLFAIFNILYWSLVFV